MGDDQSNAIFSTVGGYVATFNISLFSNSNDVILVLLGVVWRDEAWVFASF